MMELVAHYLLRYIPKRNPLPFPQYLMPENKWKNSFWITKEGECVYPWQMNTRHLLNTIRLIHRSNMDFETVYNRCHADKHLLSGPIVSKQKKKSMRSDQVKEYNYLWEKYYLYMLLRREIKLRGLEDSL